MPAPVPEDRPRRGAVLDPTRQDEPTLVGRERYDEVSHAEVVIVLDLDVEDEDDPVG